MDLCPGMVQECGRPLKSGEDLCPACRSQKRRMGPISSLTVYGIRRLLKETEKSLRAHGLKKDEHGRYVR